MGFKSPVLVFSIRTGDPLLNDVFILVKDLDLRSRDLHAADILLGDGDSGLFVSDDDGAVIGDFDFAVSGRFCDRYLIVFSV